MRKNLSVFMLAARSSIYRITAILFIMTAAESVLLYYGLKTIRDQQVSYTISEVVSHGKIPLIFGVTFLVICLCLALTGCEFSGSKLRYTVQRLSVREEVTVHWWTLYNAAVLFIFWTLQAAIVFGFSKIYMQYINPEYTSNMSIFIAFCDNEFLHSLLPVVETSRYIRNIVLVLTLAETIAVFSYRMRHDKKDLNMIVLIMLTFTGFKGAMGRFSADVCIIIVALVLAGFSAADVLRRKADSEY